MNKNNVEMWFVVTTFFILLTMAIGTVGGLVQAYGQYYRPLDVNEITYYTQVTVFVFLVLYATIIVSYLAIRSKEDRTTWYKSRR